MQLFKNKRGQLSYEYIVVIGMILLLAIPFFYTFFRYLWGSFNSQMNQDMLIRVGHATETVANLGGVGTSLVVPGRLSRITTNVLQKGRLTVTTSTGQVYSASIANPNAKISSQALIVDGGANIPVALTYLDTVGIGSGPIIAGTCIPSTIYPNYQDCKVADSAGITIAPEDPFKVVGLNFVAGSKVLMHKVGKNEQPTCTWATSCLSNADCANGQSCENGICGDITPSTTMITSLLLNVNTEETGKGQYTLEVVNPGAQVSSCTAITVQPVQVGQD